MSLSRLVTLSISLLCDLDAEANALYDKVTSLLYGAALLIMRYTQHDLCPFIGSKSNHIRHFITT